MTFEIKSTLNFKVNRLTLEKSHRYLTVGFVMQTFIPELPWQKNHGDITCSNSQHKKVTPYP